MPAVRDPLYSYTVKYQLFGDYTPSSKTMPAAYFVEEGRLTIFKDQFHRAVFAIPTDTLVSVTRGESA